jgi:hypothetical protein
MTSQSYDVAIVGGGAAGLTRTLNGELAATFRKWYPAFSLTDQPADDDLLAA